jgi:hypothetical protein
MLFRKQILLKGVLRMNPLYVAADELGVGFRESDMKDLERLICEQDGIENPALVCVNDSSELAELLTPLDFNDIRNWCSLIVLLVPNGGEIRSYRPRRLAETFKSRAKPGKKTYDLFSEILELAL